MKVLVDTNAVTALVLRNDRNYAAAVEALRRFTEAGAALVLTNFIVAEIYNLLAARAYPAKAREWFQATTWPVERVSEEDEEEARRILEKYADKDFSYTDATT